MYKKNNKKSKMIKKVMLINKKTHDFHHGFFINIFKT